MTVPTAPATQPGASVPDTSPLNGQALIEPADRPILQARYCQSTLAAIPGFVCMARGATGKPDRMREFRPGSVLCPAA